MNPTLIVVPTLHKEQGDDTARRAMLSAHCNQVRVVVIHDERGEGFTKTVNRGIAGRLPGEDLCILNDDVYMFTPGWLNALQHSLYIKDSYGIVGPSGKSRSSSGVGKPGDSGFCKVNSLPFWCVLIKSDVVDEIGRLDSDFIHYSSDTWYCVMTRRAGWECMWVKPVYLFHEREGSGFKQDWKKHDAAVLRGKMRELKISIGKVR